MPNLYLYYFDMNSFRSCSFNIVLTSLVVITTFCGHVKQVDGSILSFCDGNKYMEKTREQCGAGVTFGENKPDCICVSGIYRFIADSCETADGFAETVCTKLSDENGFGANIVAVKFAKDPQSWAQTGVVADRRGFGTETWDFITDKHSRGSTTRSNNIYALNGKAFMVTGHHGKQAFCVEPAKLPESERICRYLKSENELVWKDAEVEIMVQGRCDGNPKPLIAHKCFGLLKNTDSECTLNCSPKSTIIAPILPMGRSFSSKVSNSQGSKKSKVSMMGRAFAPPAPVAPAPFVPLGPVGGVSLTNGLASPVDPIPVDYWKHDNKFLNRKMMIYNIISQLNIANISNSTYGEPKRTFELFDMMKDITTSYCPSKFVWPDWIDLVIDLFYVIHKGNVFKYDETLSVEEHEWIKDILTKCHDRVISQGSINLSNDPTLPDAEEPECRIDGGGTATGFCNGTKPDGSVCNFVPVILPDDRANDSYHYVPEVAWDVVDIIQVICFPEFNVSYRMFHVLEQAAERLFTLQVKNLWYYPSWSDKTKKRLLGTSADTQLHNLEVCLTSAYYINGLIPRLIRPRPVKYLRKKRAARNPPQTSVGSFVDVYCSKSRKEFMTPMNKKCSQD